MTLRKLLTIGLFVLGVALPLDSALADSRCESCQKKAVAPCNQSCARVADPTLRTKCIKGCQLRSCRKPCNPVKSPAAGIERRPDLLEEDLEKAPVEGGLKDCQSCMRQQEKKYCRDLCLDGDVALGADCINRCARRQCAQECLLPGRPSKEPPKPKKRDCAQCKSFRQQRCSQKCGPKDRAGYVACEVSCIEEACLEVCNPQLF